MNLNHMFLCLLGVVFLCAVAYAQTPVAEFTCQDGWCAVKEEQARNLVNMFHAIQEELFSLKGKTGCT